jgi:hypothetical protein
MTWKTHKRFKKVAKIVTAAVAGAENRNAEVAAGQTGGSVYLGDMMSLVLLHKAVFEGDQSWAEDPSEDGQRLRDIAKVLADWPEFEKHAKERFPDDAERRFGSGQAAQRAVLSTIAWVITGKPLDEAIRAAGGPWNPGAVSIDDPPGPMRGSGD